MKKLYQYVVEQTNSGQIEKTTAVNLVKLLKQEEGKQPEQEIAIIGMATRMPMAKDIHAFWENLRDGIDCVTEFPLTRRKNTDPIVYSMGISNPEYSVGSFLEEVDLFDYRFFGISPREASLMDPHQRLFLQTAWHAIEDSGYGEKLRGTKTGVYLGISTDFGENYKSFIQASDPSALGVALPGNIKSIIASRIAYLLDLKGPSMMVDTACSSVAVSVHLACQAIRLGECEMALAGGVKLNLFPYKFEDEFHIGIESSDGKTKTFDDRSDGTGLGEGVAAILLKPLSKALKDNDPIHAIIKGSAINQDGHSIGITAPNANAQRDVIVQAWKHAKIDPETITYIEAHGTGTKLGDPIEINGIEMAFRQITDKKQFCAISSVKTNLGHLDFAAGIAGLVKAVLALKHKQLPPNIHFERPNRQIPFVSSPLYVNDRLIKWESSGSPARCGVSSFGLSGTNCHIVLEEAPQPAIDPTSTVTQTASTPEDILQVLALSAKSKSALLSLIRAYHNLLLKEAMIDLTDVCYTANTGRGHYTHRIAVMFRTRDELLRSLSSATDSNLEATDSQDFFYGKHTVVIQHSNREMLPGDITEVEKRRLSEAAHSTLTKEKGETLLADLCRLYVHGADITWEAMHQQGNRRRLHLPVYPFEEKHAWVPILPVSAMQRPSRQGEKDLKHPLLDRVIEMPEQIVSSTTFSVDTHWLLSEHIVGESYVAPGTTYLEMVRAVYAIHAPGQPVALQDITFLSPLAIKADEPKEVQLIVNKTGDSHTFTVTSRSHSDSGWIKHVEGRIRLWTAASSTYATKQDISAIKQRCGHETVILPQTSTSTGFIKTGRHWDTLRKVYRGNTELLAYLELPQELKNEAHQYGLHPSLLDCAVNVAIQHLGAGPYLPFFYKSFHMFHPLPNHVYSHLRWKESFRRDQETATFDISLLDERGELLVWIEGYTIKKVHQFDQRFSQSSDSEHMYHEIAWEPVPLEKKQQQNVEESVVIFKGGCSQDEIVIGLLRQAGRTVIEVEHGEEFGHTEEEYVDFLRTVKESHPTQIILLSPSADTKPADSFSKLQEKQNAGVISLFHLSKALFRSRFREHIELVVVAHAANEITRTESVILPEHAALFGLAKVIDNEFDKLTVRCIDVDGATPASDIFDEITGSSIDRMVGYREGIRYLQTFRPLPLTRLPDKPFFVRDNGVYLITGGTGGIGLVIAKHLAAQNKVTLCLSNRSAMPPREQWDVLAASSEDPKMRAKLNALLEIEEMGSRVVCFSADVSKETDVLQLLAKIRETCGPLNGIIHSAGIAGNGILLLKDKSSFERVLATKIQGTWLLDHLTEEDNLDFLILFSSMTAFTGGLGQSDYTAANAYLDSYAAFRSKQGRRTVTINWPAWRETGMAVDFGVNEMRSIFYPITNSKSLQAFDQIVRRDVSRVIVGEVDTETLDKFLPYLYMRVDAPVAIPPIHKPVKSSTPSSSANTVITGRKDGAFNVTEVRMARIWSRVLGLEEINIYDNFTQLGGDSIMATHLLKELDIEFPDMFDISDIFTYPSVQQMVEYLTNLTGPQSDGPSAPESEPASMGMNRVEEILEKLALGEISVSDADNLLIMINDKHWT
ncbi:SDR family NAD(P)-dependent oxidoreductase [Brevibacillus antibioticus]|uniref:SDR family NAD(P)-dependent oxidoreductase n=1 Tax=Brevibacillus antibioticus TaxID=2570228 RepID=A0A4U2Y3U0_9BACL|nr:type I polyketide synthase [Brevibacillus antibioticus]TKI55079.1 SDR family NAD(P)-dependent oxidoreductase [Brevibacillus antibioticus]